MCRAYIDALGSVRKRIEDIHPYGIIFDEINVDAYYCVVNCYENMRFSLEEEFKDFKRVGTSLHKTIKGKIENFTVIISFV